MLPDSLVFENACWRVELERALAGLSVTVDNPRDGRRWGPSPLLRLRFHDKMYHRVETTGRYVVDEIERFENGCHITISVGGISGLSAGLWLRLQGDELVAALHPYEVYETEPVLFRWAGIDPFPELIRVGSGGALLLPVTTGALCRPGGKARLSDRFLIYGEQERSELLPLLPFCAGVAEYPRGGGLMALAVRGAPDTACFVATDGQGGGEVGLGFSFRRLWIDPLDPGTREIRFLPIPRGEDAQGFVARRLRRHVRDDLGKPTLRERAQEAPEVAYALNAYSMKPFFGLQNNTGIIRTLFNPGDLGSRTSFDTMMTFAQCQTGLKQLRETGVERVLTFLTGWSPRGHDGLYPTRLPPDERLGGEHGFRELIAFGQGLGYAMSVHDNYIDGYKSSPDWDAEVAIHDRFGEPLVMGLWGGGVLFKLWPLALSPERLDGQMREVHRLGVRGMYYCDAMGNLLEVNHHPRHGGPRSGHAAGVQRVLQAARRTFGAAATECGFLYAATEADSISTVGWTGPAKSLSSTLKPEWPITDLCDRQLPIWQLALHDLVLLEGHELSWRGAMLKVLLGLHPRVEWCARSGLYIKALDEALIAGIKADYDLCLERFGFLQTLQLTGYEEHDQTLVSSFEDGTQVIADLEREELWVGGERIARPEALPARGKDAYDYATE